MLTVEGSMLLRFGVQNHRSIRDYQEVSFARSALAGPEHVTVPAHGASRGILPVMGLYGSNASGKTSLVLALSKMVQHILGSHAELKPTDPMPHDPFLLDEEHRTASTRFDVDVVVAGVHHHYGFSLTPAGVEEEWLYAWPGRHKQLWFHRQGTDRAAWYFGGHLAGQRARIAELTRDNSLFLSAAAQNNHPQLLPLYQHFESRYRFTVNTNPHEPMLRMKSPLFDPGTLPRVIRLLRGADLGIVEAKVEDRRDKMEALVEVLRERGWPLADDLEKGLASEGAPSELILGHACGDGAIRWLAAADESGGTVALLNHLHQILPTLDLGGLVTIDELDRGLHPDLVKAVVSWFTDPGSNPRGAQLLFTTHDQSVLEVLRRDEVVIVDKLADGATVLTPVSNFKTLKRDDLRSAYAEGRYGGVPRLARFGRAVVEQG